MTDTKELRRLLAERDSANPKTLLWHFRNNVLKDALADAAPELLDRLERAEQLLSLAAEMEIPSSLQRAIADFLAPKETL